MCPRCLTAAHRVHLPPPRCCHRLLQVLALVGSDNYLHRMTVLAAIGALSASVNKEVVHNSMLPAVVACSKVGAAEGGRAGGGGGGGVLGGGCSPPSGGARRKNELG